MDLRSYWQQLQPREQKLLQLLGAIIVLLLVYSLIISPFSSSKAELEQDLQSRKALLETVNNAALQKQRVGGAVVRPQNKKANIVQTVRTTINQQQLTASMKSINEKGRSKLTVTFSDVSYDAINTWLMSLAQQHGINVVSLQASDKGNNDGMVDLQVELGQ